MLRVFLAGWRIPALKLLILLLTSVVTRADVLVSTEYGFSENAIGFGSVERFNETSGQMTATGQIYDPSIQASGVAQGPDGSIYVSNRGTGQIMHYSYSGSWLGVFATLPPDAGAPAAPTAIHFGPDGNLFVSDSGGSTIQRYNIATGQLMNNVVTGLASPGGFAFSRNGDLFVCDFGGGRIVKVTGNPQSTTDVTPDAQGHSPYNYIVANFNPQNGPVVPMRTPNGIVLNGYMLVSDSLGNQVLTFSGANLINQSTVPPPIPNPLPPGASSASNNPAGLALDRSGNALLAVRGIDSNNSGAVLKYNIGGDYISTLSSGLPGPSDLTLVSPQSTWSFNGSGNFGDAAKWDTMTFPNKIGQSALFSSTSGGGFHAVTVNGAYTVGSLVFANTNGTSFALIPDAVAGHGITLNNGGIGGAVNVTSDVHFVNVQITLADRGGHTFYVAPNAILSVDANIGEPENSFATLNKAGEGVLILTGKNTYRGGTTVSNGLLILQAENDPVVAALTTITVSNTGSLELAGSVSALRPGANIVNNSTADAGVIVTGTNQIAGDPGGGGGIDGSGTTIVEAGSDLTVGRIVQGALVLNGTADRRAKVVIAPYNRLVTLGGTPLDALSLFGAPLTGTSRGSELLVSSNGTALTATAGATAAFGESSVPEPSAMFLTLSAACGLLGYGVSRSRREEAHRRRCVVSELESANAGNQ